MLILRRRRGEQLIIGDSVVVKVLRIRRGQVSLGVEAPKRTSVHRQEVYDRLAQGEPPRSRG